MLSFDHVIQKPELKIQTVLHDTCISSQFKKNNVPKKNRKSNKYISVEELWMILIFLVLTFCVFSKFIKYLLLCFQTKPINLPSPKVGQVWVQIPV